jgi:alpha-mannosidase
MRPRADIAQRYVDQGEHEYHIRLALYGERPPCSEYARRALELNQAPLYTVESVHRGALPREKSYCGVKNGSTALVTAIKRAEDNDGWIVRAVESAGKAGEAEIDFSWIGCSGRFSFGPFEIKTIKISDKGVISDTNLLEWQRG